MEFKNPTCSPALSLLAPVDFLFSRERDEVDIQGFRIRLARELSFMKRAAYPNWSRLLVSLTVTRQAFELDSIRLRCDSNGRVSGLISGPIPNKYVSFWLIL
jgi:hypothetical protein